MLCISQRSMCQDQTPSHNACYGENQPRTTVIPPAPIVTDRRLSLYCLGWIPSVYPKRRGHE